jgi:formylglycine-generating enzyme required for sulfatase activity
VAELRAVHLGFGVRRRRGARVIAVRRLLAIVLAGSVLAVVDRAGAFVPPPANRVERRADMVLVPSATYRFEAQASWQGPYAGTSTLGDPLGYEVTVSSFFIDRTEVTVAAYGDCVAAGSCPPLVEGDNYSTGHTPLCTYGKPGMEQHPVNCVTHDEAEKFCAFVGKRLPTEYEFELAERGPNVRAFPWGAEAASATLTNACDAACARDGSKVGDTFTSLYVNDPNADDGWAFTAPVGTYPAGASMFGALDLSGNVEEWVSDSWWDLPPAGTSGVVGPQVKVPGGDFVVRGGSWDLNTMESFCGTRRTSAGERTRAAWLGFRCARDA